VPTGVIEGTVKVMTEVHVGEHPWFEIFVEIRPTGTPERERVTDSVTPAVRVLVIVFVVKASPDVLVTLDVPEFERV